MTTIQDEARFALDAKRAAEHNLATLSLCPPWRHAAFAGLEATLVASPGVSLPLRFLMLALFVVGIVLIVRSDRRRLGVFINGYRRGKTRLVALPLMVLMLGLYLTSVYFGLSRGQPLVCFALALLTFGMAYVGSILWQRVFVRELGA